MKKFFHQDLSLRFLIGGLITCNFVYNFSN